jgi:hypothetical protein
MAARRELSGVAGACAARESIAREQIRNDENDFFIVRVLIGFKYTIFHQGITKIQMSFIWRFAEKPLL